MAKASFGLGFTIVNDVVQPVKGLAMGNPPQRVIHHATIRRGLDEYVVIAGARDNALYLNRISRDTANPGLLAIEDDTEFNELVAFLKESGIFSINAPKKHASS